MNSSLDILCLSFHSNASFSSTFTCVDIHAWSVPGIRIVSSHFILWYLVIKSSNVSITE